MKIVRALRDQGIAIIVASDRTGDGARRWPIVSW